MEKYRKYTIDELESLIGNKVRMKNAGLFLINGVTTDVIQVGLQSYYYSRFYSEFTHSNGDTLGVKQELSADGFTKEELQEKQKNGEALQVLGFNEWIDKYNMEFTESIENYRVKPQQKYIRPKVGFRGSIICETKSNIFPTWNKQEVVAVYNDKYKGVTAIVIGHSYTQFRLLPFSKENPPSKNTRFTSNFEIYDESIIRYVDCIEKGRIIDSQGNSFNFENIEFIDFELIKNEE